MPGVHQSLKPTAGTSGGSIKATGAAA